MKLVNNARHAMVLMAVMILSVVACTDQSDELSGSTQYRWILNGHKVWTSLAHFASWMILLARTSRDDKYKGLSYFIVPIAGAQGVTVRPLIKITGETGFNEVLFEDLVVADTFRVDEVGKGWTVAMTTLTHERGAADSAGGGGGFSLEDKVQALIALAKRTPRGDATAWDDAVLRDRIVQILIRAEGLNQTFRRARVPALAEDPMRLMLQGKVLISELMQDLSALRIFDFQVDYDNPNGFSFFLFRFIKFKIPL